MKIALSTLKCCAAVLLPVCILMNVINLWHAPHAEPALASVAPEWPTRWEGAALRPLALSAVEARFAQGFPGQIARLTNERDVLVWRYVTRPTRMLHPAADCYRAAGWRISDERLEQTEVGRWRCFTARSAREGEGALRVCERITDGAGQSFTDASAWYWAAALGQSSAPWQALTVARPL
ncbi:hypothetical protein AGMMS49543_15930 [Betaproteobacteria bacterium]|nr:hypothetical protein AGMMS49543_15930 [Betaproteobacteria bacterium]GHU19325.1 hypothetical protein AGMMS50243_11080 [Betaproteobacteria bacterium]